jgi:hypothetical protein
MIVGLVCGHGDVAWTLQLHMAVSKHSFAEVDSLSSVLRKFSASQ